MQRNFGLDVYRTIAIVAVLLSHCIVMFFPTWSQRTPIVYALGFGVEIFFALSGFLIGGILIRDVVESPHSAGAPRKLLTFYAGRWLRTLPLYYFMVILSILLTLLVWPLLMTAPPQLHWPMLVANFIFLQNFRQNWLTLQPVSWSLAIEEWFYLLIPLVMALIATARSRRLRSRLILCIGMAIIVATLVYRGCDFLLNHTDWDFGTRKQIFMHMDALMFGLLAAWLKRYHASVFNIIARSRWTTVIALVTVAVVIVTTVYVPASQSAPNGLLVLDDSFMAHTFTFTFLGACFAALVMTCYSQLKVPASSRWIMRLFNFLSARSYGYYLLHWPTFLLLANLHVGAYVSGVALSGIGLILTGLFAETTYRLIERPGMRLRSRIRLVPQAHDPLTEITTQQPAILRAYSKR